MKSILDEIQSKPRANRKVEKVEIKPFVAEAEDEDEKEIFCPMCGASCGKGMGSGRIYMLHHTVGCEEAQRHMDS